MHKLKNSNEIAIILLLLWLKTVMVMVVGFNIPLHSFLDALLIFINPIGSLMIAIGFSFYFAKSIKPLKLFLIFVFLTGILYADLLYYRFYSDYVTLPILFQFKNVGGIGPSTFELMSPWDILLFVDVIFAGWYLKNKRRMMSIPSDIKVKYITMSLLILTLPILIGLIKAPYLFQESYDREQMVTAIGPFNYHVYDSVYALAVHVDPIVASKVDTSTPLNYTTSKKEDHSDLFGIAEGKNVILVSMESTQNFVINSKIAGSEVTPFLNSLVKDSYYFNQIYDQTAQGKTSDSEFMIDNGLYPLSGGSVFVRYPDNEFLSMPRILQDKGGYYSAVFHGNDASFWNRDKMYDSLGYDRFYSKKDYEVTDHNSINYGIKDIPFFEQSISYLKNLPQPFYTRIITLTNHFPFLLEEEDQYIPPATTNVDVVNRYVTTVRYEDEAIKRFFERLKENGIYEDSIIILYGDHYGISKKYESGVFDLLDMEDSPKNELKLQKVPLIIHIPGMKGKTINTIGGEIDIRPTILHLLGIESNENLSFGHNLFARVENHPVIFRDGEFVTEKYFLKDNICYSRKNGKQTSAEKCEPYQKIARKELGMSDDIIFGDLLRLIE
ncbi:LTA synthase family protein [Rossellomorea aquimaris]|uniref:LTA synthase family protein n=1 Tax=Rossellomorea aquimaris TaxID=189382 RepID=UPI001CD58D0B|nr:LTA synthase family protein [Rossellomorea aquimaris]MCA1053683.1 LTA synthase family protein [Rossellomorea aquimaris]